MCFSCEDDPDEAADAQAVVTPQLIRFARKIELDLPGEPVADDLWSIFFGAGSGAIPWPAYERMARCREAAQVLISAIRA